MANLPGTTRATLLHDLARLGASSAHDEVLSRRAGLMDDQGTLRVPLAQVVDRCVEVALDALESNGMIGFTIKLGERYEYRVSARGGKATVEEVLEQHPCWCGRPSEEVVSRPAPGGEIETRGYCFLHREVVEVRIVRQRREQDTWTP